MSNLAVVYTVETLLSSGSEASMVYTLSGPMVYPFPLLSQGNVVDHRAFAL